MKTLFKNYLIKLEKKEIKEFVPPIKKEIKELVPIKKEKEKEVKLYLGNSLYKEIFG